MIVTVDREMIDRIRKLGVCKGAFRDCAEMCQSCYDKISLAILGPSGAPQGAKEPAAVERVRAPCCDAMRNTVCSFGDRCCLASIFGGDRRLSTGAAPEPVYRCDNCDAVLSMTADERAGAKGACMIFCTKCDPDLSVNTVAKRPKAREQSEPHYHRRYGDESLGPPLKYLVHGHRRASDA